MCLTRKCRVVVLVCSVIHQNLVHRRGESECLILRQTGPHGLSSAVSTRTEHHTSDPRARKRAPAVYLLTLKLYIFTRFEILLMQISLKEIWFQDLLRRLFSNEFK